EASDPFSAAGDDDSPDQLAAPVRPHAPPIQFRQRQKGSRKIIKTAATESIAEPGKLPAPGKDSARRMAAADGKRSAPRGMGLPTSLPNVLGSLAAVLGLFLCVAWMFRRSKPRGTTPLPGE